MENPPHITLREDFLLSLLQNLKENQDHAYKNKLQIAVRWEQSGQEKLSEKDVLGIRVSNLSRKELSLKFKVRESCICKIIKRQRWTHI